MFASQAKNAHTEPTILQDSKSIEVKQRYSESISISESGLPHPAMLRRNMTIKHSNSQIWVNMVNKDGAPD